MEACEGMTPEAIKKIQDANMLKALGEKEKDFLRKLWNCGFRPKETDKTEGVDGGKKEAWGGMTVGRLRELLDDFSPLMPVVVRDGEWEWREVEEPPVIEEHETSATPPAVYL